MVAASYAIAFLYGAPPPNAGELTSVALLAIAMLVLSPLHHLRVRRIRVEEPVSHGWLVFSRSPTTANATDR